MLLMCVIRLTTQNIVHVLVVAYSYGDIFYLCSSLKNLNLFFPISILFFVLLSIKLWSYKILHVAVCIL